MVQPDVKRLVAYSSVAHMGFVILGMFSFTEQGMQGAVYQMLNHGVSTGALFLLVGFIYERRHTREITRVWRARECRCRSTRRSLSSRRCRRSGCRS